MSGWILAILILVGGFFGFKLLYLLATAWALPMTQGALFTSTASVRIKTFLDAVPMSAHEMFVDLGCGDGRVLRAARRRYGIRALGFEVNALAYCTARIFSFGKKGVQIIWRNFWSVNLRDADVVFCYLFPDVMKRLATKLEAELRPGARVVSCNFSVPGWNPLEVVRPDSAYHGDPIYIYRWPDSCPSSTITNLRTAGPVGSSAPLKVRLPADKVK